MNTKGLNVRDLINVGLFGILVAILTFLSGFIGFIPVLVPLTQFMVGLVTGPVNMLYSTRIKKAGMLFIQQLIVALLFGLTAHGIWIIFTTIISAILAEIVLKMGNYNSVKYARFAFVVAAIGGIGNWIPIFIGRDKYIERMLQTGYSQDYIDRMMSVLPQWILIPMTILGMIGTFIGCTIGISILKKHFVKAGMV